MQITRLATPTHETVLRVHDASIGLTGFIAVHSTKLGPAAGGLRMRPYESEDAALTDALLCEVADVDPEMAVTAASTALPIDEPGLQPLTNAAAVSNAVNRTRRIAVSVILALPENSGARLGRRR